MFKEDSDKQKDSNQINQIEKIEEQNLDQDNTVCHHKQQYDKYFQGIRDININDYLQQLSQYKIKYSERPLTKDTNFEIISKTHNLSVINLLVTFTHFIFEVSLLNLEEESSSLQQLKFLSSGSNGILYLCKKQIGQQFVVKSRRYNYELKDVKENNNQVKNILYEAIEEYCFCKLCSALKIGPYMPDYLGFDLLVFNSTVEFSMEVCKSQSKITPNQLKENLKLLHSFKIIHGDIKPENIMWSQVYQKLIFIDFGYSLNLKEQIGKLTWTSYFGTLNYSSPEMYQCFNKNQNQLVDLYYNDIYGLEKSITKITLQISIWKSRINRQYDKHKQFYCSKKYLTFLLNTKLKKLIFEKELEQIKNLCRREKNYFISKQCLSLFSEIKPSRQTTNILNFFVEKYSLKGQQDIKNLLQFHKRRILQLTKENNPSNNFKMRIQEKISKKEYKNDNNDIVKFIRISFLQDISSNPRIEKQQLFKKLDQTQENNNQIAFCWLMVMIVKNLHTSKQEILDLFKRTIKFLNLEVQFDKIPKYYQIFQKAYQIKQAVQEKYNIDLTKVYEQIQKEEERVIKQKFSPTEKQLHNLIEESLEKQVSLQKYTEEQKTRDRENFLKKAKQIIKNTNPNKFFMDLVIQNIKINLQEFGNKKLQPKYKMLEKLLKFEAATKCKIVKMALQQQLKYCNQELDYYQTKNLFIKIQENSQNYCFEKKTFSQSYFQIYIIQKIIEYRKLPQNLKQVYENLRKYFEIFKTYIFNKTLYRIVFYANYLEPNYRQSINNYLLKLILQTYEKYEDKINKKEIEFLFEYFGYCSQQFQDKKDNIQQYHDEFSKIQLLRPEKEIIRSIIQKYDKKLSQISQIKNLKMHKFHQIEINIKLKLKLISNEQYFKYISTVIDKKLNFPSKIEDQFACRILAEFILNSMIYSKTNKLPFHPILQTYIPKLQDYFNYQCERQILSNKYILDYVQTLIVYYLNKNDDIREIYGVISKISKEIDGKVQSQISIINIYLIGYIFLGSQDENIVTMRIDKIINIFKEEFYQNYESLKLHPSKILILSELIFIALIEMNKIWEKFQQIMVIFKISHYLLKYCQHSYIISRFKITAQVMTTNLKFVNLIYKDCPNYKKRLATLKCLRGPLYYIGIPNTIYILKKLNKKLQKYPRTDIAYTKNLISQKIKNLNQNKQQSLQKKPIIISSIRLQIFFFEWLNSRYLTTKKFYIRAPISFLSNK